MIPSVLADRQQAFSSGQQAQARANIDAQKSISYSYDNNTITAIDGSAVGQPGALTEVVHDSNLSGSGTSASPLGLASEITLSASGLPYTSTITPYSVQMCQTGSATSYFGLNYFWLRDSAGGESYYNTDALNISDSGDVDMTANASAVTFYNDPDHKQSASYSYSGVALSSDDGAPNTATLSQTSLVLKQSGSNSSDVQSAVYSYDMLKLGKTATTQSELSSRLVFSYDEGGNLVQTTFGPMGFSGSTYTPTGTNVDLYQIMSYGLTGVSNFGTYKIDDSWYKSKRMQCDSTGTPVSFIETYIGYHDGNAETYPAYICFYNKDSGSSYIYQSSINAWDNNLSAVSAGYGLSGNGTSGSPLCVTGLKNEYSSPYASSCISSDRTSIDILTDEYSARMHDDGFWVTYGGSVFHSSTVQMRADNLSINDYTTDDNVYLNASSVRLYYHLNDSTASASAEINASVLTSLFAWAMNNGWNP